MNGRFAAVKVIEGDQDIIRQLKLSENELEMMEHSIIEMETDRGLDRNAAMADMRYRKYMRTSEPNTMRYHAKTVKS